MHNLVHISLAEANVSDLPHIAIFLLKYIGEIFITITPLLLSFCDLILDDPLKMFGEQCSENFVSMLPITFAAVDPLVREVLDQDGEVLHLHRVDVERLVVKSLTVFQGPRENYKD